MAQVRSVTETPVPLPFEQQQRVAKAEASLAQLRSRLRAADFEAEAQRADLALAESPEGGSPAERGRLRSCLTAIEIVRNSLRE